MRLIITKNNSDSGEVRCCTAHDLRRYCATRPAQTVLADLLQVMMRHADLKTTRIHYADVNAEQQAELLWNAPR